MRRELLIIDDEAEIGRVLQRILVNSFDAIHVATSGSEAEAFLEQFPITHIVCDLYLGAGEPLGHELVRKWRAWKSTIQYVALFTGSSIDPMPHNEDIDAVYRKPLDLEDLVATLRS